MATSGLALSDRIAAVIKPAQSKKDEDAVYDVEKWLDDMRECRSLGASELEYDYRLTALRMIATDSIREKMDYEDAKVQDTQDKEERYKTQLDTLMRWAHQKMVNSNKTKSTKMDVNGIAGAEGWGQQPEQYDHFMGMMKGKGKGYYPKGGYGSSKGWQQ